MLLIPKPIGNQKLPKDELEADKKNCRKIGPCGIGKKAIYLNSFFIDRQFYVVYNDVRRIFKRVAMSKNGFTGKGAFGTMPYLVVLLSDGSEKQCNFKYEYEVDNFIRQFHMDHPQIPIHSAEAEKRLAEERKKEEARYVKNLSEEAAASIAALLKAQDFLNTKPEIYGELSRTAKQKRVIDNINPTYKFVAFAIAAFAVAACAFGVYSLFLGQGYAMYFLLFGAAFIFFVMSMQVLPTAKNNRSYAQKEFDRAVSDSEAFLEHWTEGSFPVPARYAHPSTLNRMIRVLREGRAQITREAYDVMKADLKAINNTVTVSQLEYDEIVAIKPMFLIFNYED